MKNPKIVKFEKTQASNVLSSAEVDGVSSSTVNASREGDQRNGQVETKKTKITRVGPVLSTVTPVKKSVSEATIARRKYSAGDILPTRIVIDKIGVDIGVFNPEWNDIPTLTEALKGGAVRYPQSGLLEENSNMLLFGHSTHLQVIYNKAYKAFNDLDQLLPGDEIEVYSSQKIYIYEVKSVNLVKHTEGRVDLTSRTPILTLVTCNNFGAKEDRYVVVAELVGEVLKT